MQSFFRLSLIITDILSLIVLNENVVAILRKFVPNCLIDNKPVLIQVMAWRRTGDKPLSEPWLAEFTDACVYVARTPWTNTHRLGKISDTL